MSGRKRSEVGAVVANAKGSRNDIFENYLGSIQTLIREFDSVEVPSANLKELQVSPNASSLQHFSTQVKSLRDEMISLQKREIQSNSFSSSAFKSRWNELLSEIQKTDNLLDRIIHSLNTNRDGHYMDEEFEAGINAIRRYESIKEELYSLEDSLYSALQNKRNAAQTNSHLNARAEELRDSLNGYNEKAELLAKNELESNRLIQSSRELFSKIARQDAEKYLKKEFQELEVLQNKFQTSGMGVLNSFAMHFKKLEDFISLLSRRKQEFERDKAMATQKKTTLESIYSSLQYTDPLNKDKTISGRELANSILNQNNLFVEYDRLVSQISKEMGTDNFSNSLSNLDKALEELQSIRKRLDLDSIQVKEQIQTAIAIEEVLLESGFQVDISFKDGMISNGIVIHTNPDTYHLTLNNKDGKIDIDLDHNETPSSCSVSVSELQNKLNRRGVRFRVTDWGNANDGKRQKISEEKKGRERA